MRSEERHDVWPDIVVQNAEGVLRIKPRATTAARVNVAVLDAEEERGAGDGGAAGGGERAQEGYDGGARIVVDGVVKRDVAGVCDGEHSRD